MLGLGAPPFLKILDMKNIKIIIVFVILLTGCSKVNNLDGTNWAYNKDVLSFQDEIVCYSAYINDKFTHLTWMNYRVNGNELICTNDTISVIFMHGVFKDASTLVFGDGDIELIFKRQ